MIEPVEGMCFQRLLDAVEQFHVGWVVKIAHPQQTFRLINTFFGQHGRVGLFVDYIVAGFSAIDILTLFQVRDDGIGVLVFVGSFI